MNNVIESKVELSVARGCAFAGIGIVTMMIGAITSPPLAFLTGGIATLFAACILALKGRLARTIPYKRTETWLMLDKPDRPQAPVAQQVIGNVLREVYYRFALYAAQLALAMLIASILFRILPATNASL